MFARSIVRRAAVPHGRTLFSTSPLRLQDSWADIPDYQAAARNVDVPMAFSPKARPLTLKDTSFDEKTTPAARWKAYSDENSRTIATMNKIDNFEGRTVWATRGIRNALTTLDDLLKENSVRRTWTLQKRHAKRGVLRNERHSKAWRRTFAHEIRKKIQLVHHIRSRGA
ncbi:hypothetical protein DL96DRAFT_1703244 [Flagelloscypha sp. PMI_526]|nr:hypothetical protein DL96DRAFT_1703244 [Flagelloscypha sp. PMI_526]